MPYCVGDRVECYYGDDWYPGTIRVINKPRENPKLIDNSNGVGMQKDLLTYFVAFDDGDVLPDAISDEIRLPIAPRIPLAIAPGNSSPSRPTIATGDAIRSDDPQDKEENIALFPGRKDRFSNAAVRMADIISSIERSLLPGMHAKFSSLSSAVAGAEPRERLDGILNQLAVAESIRNLQVLYRDMNDDLRLLAELRPKDAQILTNQFLASKVTKGRIKALALCRIVYGDQSLEYLKALTDLASTYAVQSLWSQVAVHASDASAVLAKVAADLRSPVRSSVQRKMKCNAERIIGVFHALRAHAVSNFGFITSQFVVELQQHMETIRSRFDISDLLPIYDFDGEMKQIIDAIRGIISEQHLRYREGKAVTQWPTWGSVIDFLRYDMDLAGGWIRDLDSQVLPQNRASLRVAFQRSDILGRGVAHPVSLAGSLKGLPLAAKLVSNVPICTELESLKVGIDVCVDASLGMFCDSNAPNNKPIAFELPLLWEEFIGKYSTLAEKNNAELLTVQILNLVGLSQLFTGDLNASEEILDDALEHLRRIGMHEEQVAVDVLNSMSQLHVVRQRQWSAGRKQQISKVAEAWVETEEGKTALKAEIREQRKVKLKNGNLVDKDRADAKALRIVLTARTEELMSLGEDRSKHFLERAIGYLIKAFELTKKSQGEFHMGSGAAALAVASVQNILGDMVAASAWLVTALKLMERTVPKPTRAIAFAQLQLSFILEKDQKWRECLELLIKSHKFYYDDCIQQLNGLSRECGFGTLQGVPPERSYPLFNAVNNCLDILKRILAAFTTLGSSQKALEYAEIAAGLAEDAYGWDSEQAAVSRSEVRIYVIFKPKKYTLIKSIFVRFAGWKTRGCDWRLAACDTELQTSLGSARDRLRTQGQKNSIRLQASFGACTL
jgi:hypothetical protein